MAPRNDQPVTRRKLITIDDRTWQALDLLARDTRRAFQELADEAFADLLKKNGRPVTLKEALRESARQQPANDGAKAETRPKRRR
jgi:myo-inositol catabolism protein IolC